MGKVVRTVAVIAAVAVAAVATAGISLIAGASVIGAVAAAASVGLVGVQYLMRPSTASGGVNLPMPSASVTGPPPTPLRRTIKQSDAPRCFIFGRTRTAGVYFFYETDTKKNLYQGIYLCDGPVDGFDGFLCDDEAFSAGSTGPLRISNAADGNNNVYIPMDGIKFIKAAYQPATPGYWTYEYNVFTKQWQWVWHDGTAAVTYKIVECAGVAFEPVNGTAAGYNSYLLNTLMVSDGYSIDGDTVTSGFQSNMSGLWSSAHLGKGITCLYTYASTNVYGNANRMKYFPNAWPEWSVVMRGARMYDPRKDSTQTAIGGSGTHRELEGGVWTLYNSTWEWTENPALIAAHYIRWLISQNLTAITGVDWVSIASAASYCDSLRTVPRSFYGSGTIKEPFARLSAVFYFNTPPREFLSNLMAACDGSYGIDKDGKFTMWIGQWEDALVTFTANDISSFTEEFVEPASEAQNEIHINYVEPRQNYQRFEAPIWRDTASQAQVGKKISTLNFDMVPSATQAYRMAGRFARRINGKKKISMTVGPRGMLAIKQRVVGLNASDFGLSGTWRVESLVPDGVLSRWQMTLREVTSDVYNDDAYACPVDPVSSLKIVNIKDLKAPQAINLRTSVNTSTQAIVTASIDTNSNSTTAAIANINEAALLQEQTLMFEGQYSTNSGSTWTTFPIAYSSTILAVDSVTRSTLVTVRGRFVSMNGSVSPWSSNFTITSA